MHRLSGTALEDAVTRTQVSLRTGRGPRAVVLVHSADCAGCRMYLEQLAAGSATFREWDGRLIVVAYEPTGRAATLVSDRLAGVQVLSDPDATLGASPAALLLADEWGEVYFAVQGDADHALPAAAEIAEWMRFLSIQCPECEQPEGEWRNVE